MRLTLLASAAFCLCSVAAHADTVFNVSAFEFGQTPTLSGTLTLDASSTAFDAADLMYNGPQGSFTFDQIPYQEAGTGRYYMSFGDTTANARLTLVLPESSLNGYQGSQICTYIQSSCPYEPGPQEFSGIATPGQVQYFTAGSVSPSAVTPEPSSFTLLGTGLLGVAGVVRRRYS